MGAWAVWALVLLTGLVHAHASGRFDGDVNDDEVMIDKLKDLWANRRHALRQLVPAAARARLQDVNEKIEFAVTPQDERFYHPPTPSRHEPPPSTSDLLHFLSPDLNLQPNLDYPGDLLQYQDEDVQYPSEYATQYRPQYRPQQRHRPSYLNQQDLPYPGGLYPAGLQDQRLLGEEEEDEGVDEDVEDAREVIRKGLTDEDYNSEGQLMMKKGDADTDKKIVKDKGEEVTDETAEATHPPSKSATSQPETMNYMHLRRAPASNHEPGYSLHSAQGQGHQQPQLYDVYFTAALAGCTAVAVCAVVGAGICWYRLNKSHRAAQDAEYPAYGVTGPNKDLSPSGDRKLAQSAHMYHYQHQKQQMIALEKSSGGERHGSTSDVDTDDEGEDNEYTVYECPGLAPTGEMEVKNPLFHDEPTPATPSIRKEAEQDQDRLEEDKSTK